MELDMKQLKRVESWQFSMAQFVQPSRKPATGLRSPFFIDRAAFVLGITTDQLRDDKFKKVAAKRRWAFSYVLAKSKRVNTQEIAMLLQQDHSTTIHGMKKAESLIKTDRDFASMVDALEAVA
jgi:chromosomal replication initiation ATPase DnaA